MPVTTPGLRPTTIPAQRRVDAAARNEDLSRVRFRRAIALVLMTLVLPGSAQLTAGNRRIGRIATRTVFACVAGFVGILGLGYLWPSLLFWLATDPAMLALIRLFLLVLALGWAALFVDAWRLGRPLDLARKHRLRLVVANALVMVMVVGVLYYAADLVRAQRSFIVTTFGNGTATAATGGRYNILLLGVDSGESRWGTRADSINVASIDADTGETILFGIPRNLSNFKFAQGSVLAEQFPDGYADEVNSLATYAADNEALFAGFEEPAIEATREAVEGITGLKINYYAMINLAGFRGLVNAMGGVTLNIREPIPKGKIGHITGYVKPGVRKVNGTEALWYARSRAAADDYSRMARQKCLMNAMLQQLSPSKVVSSFTELTKAAQGVLRTDLPASELDRFAQLALEARKHPVRTVSFVPPAIHTGSPDLELIREMVDDAIDPPEAEKKGSAADQETVEAKGSSQETSATTQGFSADKAETSGASKGNIKSGYDANAASDLSDAC